MSEAAAVLVAAGRGRRMGSDKLWIDIWGRPVWRWSLDVLLAAAPVDRVAIVHPAGSRQRFADLLGPPAAERCLLVGGGAERIDSVLAGLRALVTDGVADDTVVLVHDAARPAASVALIERVAVAARAGGGVVPVVRVPDTLKRVDGPSVRETVDRSDLVAAQTPQAGRLGELLRSLEAARNDGVLLTDDVEALRRAGMAVHSVEGEITNRKLTESGDTALLRGILRERALPVRSAAGAAARSGIGFDAHRFEAGRPLRLAGLDWAAEPRGLAGHSDGDVALHATIDALLGAAGEGDIGSHFPSDERWAAADSTELLARTVERVREAGWRPSFIDLVIVAARPAIASRRGEIAARIGEIIGLPAEAVSVKGTTSDGLGFTGSEGIAAYAVATLERR